MGHIMLAGCHVLAEESQIQVFSHSNARVTCQGNKVPAGMPRWLSLSCFTLHKISAIEILCTRLAAKIQVPVCPAGGATCMQLALHPLDAVDSPGVPNSTMDGFPSMGEACSVGTAHALLMRGSQPCCIWNGKTSPSMMGTEVMKIVKSRSSCQAAP